MPIRRGKEGTKKDRRGNRRDERSQAKHQPSNQHKGGQRDSQCALHHFRFLLLIRLIYLHAQWQHDAVWLNYLISHHHTRAVSTAMVELSTALERQWDTETFQALDALEDALRDVEQSDFPY